MELLIMIFGLLLGVILTAVISTSLIEQFYYVPKGTFLSLILSPNKVIEKCIDNCVGYETNLVARSRSNAKVFYIVNPSNLLNICLRWIGNTCSILYQGDTVYIYNLARGISTGSIYIINPAVTVPQMIDGEFVNLTGVIVSKHQLMSEGRVYKSFRSIRVFRPDTKFHPLKNSGVKYRATKLDCKTFLTRKLQIVFQK